MIAPAYPLVSILIPSYNYAEYIGQAIESALDQTYPHIEVIVVDNASTDATVAFVRERFGGDERVTLYVNDANIGAVANFNRAYTYARGEYVLWLSADDWMLPDHVRRLQALFTADGALDVAFTTCYFTDGDGNVLGMKRQSNMLFVDYTDARDELYFMLTGFNTLCLPAALFARHALGSSEVFDPAWAVAADWELAVRLALERKRFAFLKDPSMCIRRHQRNLSGTEWNHQGTAIIEWLQLLEKYRDHAGMQRLRGREQDVVAYLDVLVNAHQSSETVVPLTAEVLARVESVRSRLLPAASAMTSTRRERERSVSVIVPYVARPSALVRALNSLVEQRHTAWEAVVIDSGIIPVGELLRAHPAWPKISYVRRFPTGFPGVTRNAGIAAARYELLAFLDEDNSFESTHLESALAQIDQSGSQVVLADASCRVERDDFSRAFGERLAQIDGLYRSADDSPVVSTFANAVPLNTVVQTRRAFELAGGFNEDTPILEDYDYLVRLEAGHPFVYTRRQTVNVLVRIDLLDQAMKAHQHRYLSVLDALYAARPLLDEQTARLRPIHRKLVGRMLERSDLAATPEDAVELALVLAGRRTLQTSLAL